MKEKIKSILKLFMQFILLNMKFVKRLIIICGTLIISVILIVILIFKGEDRATTIEIEDTPIEIADIMPKGEIVVSSALIEDFATMKKTQRHMALIPEEHTCVQILKMKCSFKVDLDKVEYTKEDSSNVVWVKLPELEYVDNLQDSPFMSDDEEFWKKELPSTDKLKEKVRDQIRKRFDTPSNRRKSERFAEDAVSEILEKMGYEVEFVRKIEKKNE